MRRKDLSRNCSPYRLTVATTPDDDPLKKLKADIAGARGKALFDRDFGGRLGRRPHGCAAT